MDHRIGGTINEATTRTNQPANPAAPTTTACQYPIVEYFVLMPKPSHIHDLTCHHQTAKIDKTKQKFTLQMSHKYL